MVARSTDSGLRATMLRCYAIVRFAAINPA